MQTKQGNGDDPGYIDLLNVMYPFPSLEENKSNKQFIFGCAVFALCIATFIPSAHAASLIYTAPATISLTTPATTLTIASGSVTDVLQVNATSVAITLSGTEEFTITSPTFDLSVATSSGAGSAVLKCTANVVTMAISQGTGSTVYTITPVTTTYCSNPGAYGYPGVVEPIPFITSQAAATTTSTTTAATSPQPLLSASSTITLSTSSSNASLTAELAFLHAELAALLKQAGKQAGTASFSFVFTRNLSLGMTNGDVKQLQTLLAEDSTLYPEDKVTGYFGALTKQAVQRFQSKYGIAKAGQSVYGYVGPATRAKLNSLIKEELAP